MVRKISLHTILAIILIVAGLARLYHLNWGAPYFFHPDERNIASALSQMNLPDQLNPHFFAYGSLPLYLGLGLLSLKNIVVSVVSGVSKTTINFDESIYLLRFFSFALSTGLIYLLYKTGTRLKDKTTGIIAASLAGINVGLIQYAHFGTFEMWLSFFSLLLLFSVISFQKTDNKKYFALICISLGILISVKVSSVIFIPLALIPFYKFKTKIKKLSLSLGALALSVSGIYLLTNPYTFLDFKDFLGSMTYESNVALGKMLVFYTGEFLSAKPILFPALHVFPFLLNPIIAILFIPGLVYFLYLYKKTKNALYFSLICFFVFSAVSQFFLYVQWTRYYVPTISFILLILAVGISTIYKKSKSLGKILLIVTLLSSIIFSFAFIKTVYMNEDTRVSARDYLEKNASGDARILAENYDLGVIPFNEGFSNITLFNFYDLDTGAPDSTVSILKKEIEKSDFLLLPSSRLYKTRLLDKDNFPNGYTIYKEIAEEKNMVKIYETECDFWCKITYGLDPVFSYEQTANVFDRPTLSIYKVKK